MIGRVRDRATFQALRAARRRVRRGPVTVTFLAQDAAEARAAFAISRKVGGAVVRNRVRRRLRAILQEIERGDAGALAPGAYLISVRPQATTLSFRELSELVESACVAAADPAHQEVGR
jgi:ribonuclease P protein component